MKKNLFIPKLCSVSLAFILAQGISHAMPGMHRSGGGAATEHPRVSNSLGGKINSSGSEMEITYSADGKAAIFVSPREGSIQESVGIKANLLRQWDNGSDFLNFSLHSLAMRLKIEKIRSRSPTWLATIA